MVRTRRRQASESRSPVRAFIVLDDDDEEANDSDEYVNEGSSSSEATSSSVRRTSAVRSPRPSDLPLNASGRLTAIPTLEQAKAIEALAIKRTYEPITEIDEIFADLVKRAPLTNQLACQRIRVATICSGTEAPLLALRLIARHLDNGLDVEHVFSCEIEPFKQAYIQRNFAPPLLFRDVCELGDDQAHTAYGGLATVPGDVDILVAGTSCVDFSILNNKRKSMNDSGESGRTFFGMLRWVQRHRPRMIVLENVMTAPWEVIATHVRQAGYAVAFSNRFNTRNYYLPQTRQRGYLFACASQKHADQWIALVQGLVRPSSSPFDDFLLAPENGKLQELRQSFGQTRAATEWSKCKARHERVRHKDGLGNARPYTQWSEDGSRSLPNGGWNEWAAKQSDRILDLLDIVYLQQALKGVDIAYKSRAVQVQQNVDRNIISSRSDLCGCLTPKGEFFLTLLGRPMHGLEALALQGIPIAELDLARESSSQLLDLAGNAMSSTVVGTALLAALIVERGNKVAVDVRQPSVATVEEWEPLANVDMAAHRGKTKAASTVASLLSQAPPGRCACFGASKKTQGCQLCLQQVCEACRGRPTHVLGPVTTRKGDGNFLAALRRFVPMAVRIDGDGEHDGLLYFDEIQCTHVWKVWYGRDDVRLSFVLDSQRPRWELYAKELREPSMVLDVPHDASADDLLDGEWHRHVPNTRPIACNVELSGERCPTWESQLGLSSASRFCRLRITADVATDSGKQVTGTFELLRHCGTPMASLFRRVDGPLLFLHLQSGKHSGKGSDRFVISTDWRDESSIVVSFANGWRLPACKTGNVRSVTKAATLTPTYLLRPMPAVRFNAASIPHVCGMMTKGPEALDSCAKPLTLLTVSTTADLATTDDQTGEWRQTAVKQIISTAIGKVACVLQDVQLSRDLQAWHFVAGANSVCRRCVPTPPSIRWFNGSAEEDEQDAISHERALKDRSSALLLRWRTDRDEHQLQLGINPLALAHRAAAALPSTDAEVVSPVRLLWRMQRSNGDSKTPFDHLNFAIGSNAADEEASTPKAFRHELRPEQRRSLSWMQGREKADAEVFEEEEIEEAVLEYPEWRVQGKASRLVRLRGGVLADTVGYGKTCTMLALIASTDRDLPAGDSSFIATKATLVVVPPQLCNQWRSEIEKFCGEELNVTVLSSQRCMQTLKVAQVLQSDIVIVSAGLLRSDGYYDNLSRFSGANVLPPKSGRFFDATLEHTLRGLRNRIRSLRARDVDDMIDTIGSRQDFCSRMYSSRDDNTSASLGRGSRRPSDWLKNEPWGLRSKAVEENWRQMRCPPLESFRWKRLVVDEFHYHSDHSDRRALTTIRALVAERRWLLSGTPPTSDFSDVSLTASMLGIHLGVEDDDDSARTNVKARREKQRTETERFRNCDVVRSAAWHRRRIRVAQSFLDTFARRNRPEVAEMAYREVVQPLRMCFVERALYLEIANRLNGLETFNPRYRKDDEKNELAVEGGNDRQRRWTAVVEGSGSLEEALVTQVNVPLIVDDDETVDKGDSSTELCRFIVRQRAEECKTCLQQLKAQLRAAVDQHFVVLLERHFRNDDEQALVTFAANVADASWGDGDCKADLLAVMQEVECMPHHLTVEQGERRYPNVGRYRKDARRDWREEVKLRDMVRSCIKLRDEFANRRRGLRYMQSVLRLHSRSSVACSSSAAAAAKCTFGGEEMAVNDSCGHISCRRCAEEAVGGGRCSVSDCCALTKPVNMIGLADLEPKRTRNSNLGVKITRLIKTLRSIIADDEFALVFAQYDALFGAIAEILQQNDIDLAVMTGSAQRRSETLSRFQTGQHRVLLLDIADESAAGSNLTIANNVIFVSPFVAADKERYRATMEQAKGRVMRFGQDRTVKIWRYYVRGTIEQDILQQREDDRPA